MAYVTYDPHSDTYGIECYDDECNGVVADGYGYENDAAADADVHNDDHAIGDLYG